MAGHSQAPLLFYDKEAKMKNKEKGFTSRSVEVETLIMQGCSTVGELKVMLFLTGNAGDGSFGVAEKTVLDRCGISESTYKTARKKLKEKGWITCVDGVSITVNFDVILGCKVNTPVENNNSEGCKVNTLQGSKVNTPEGCKVNTHNNIMEQDKEKDKEDKLSFAKAQDNLSSSGALGQKKEEFKF
jgi:hypothetical protein